MRHRHSHTTQGLLRFAAALLPLTQTRHALTAQAASLRWKCKRRQMGERKQTNKETQEEEEELLLLPFLLSCVWDQACACINCRASAPPSTLRGSSPAAPFVVTQRFGILSPLRRSCSWLYAPWPSISVKSRNASSVTQRSSPRDPPPLAQGDQPRRSTAQALIAPAGSAGLPAVALTALPTVRQDWARDFARRRAR